MTSDSSHLLNYSFEEIIIFLEYFSTHISVIIFLLLGLITYFSIKKRRTSNSVHIELMKDNELKNIHEPLTLHPSINPALCGGCKSCISVCPEGDILGLVNNKAELLHPTRCLGHGECEQACPIGAIKLVFGTKSRGMNLPRLSSNYETNVKGLYIAGELGGMGLIRNAVKQGTLAAEDAAQNLSKISSVIELDIFIIGSGPAGFSAALTCKSLGLKYKCIEQNTFGGTISNFPRQKILSSKPFVLPLVGKSKFKNNSTNKMDLLNYWNEIREEYSLNISEKQTFLNLDGEDGKFVVKTSQGNYQTKKVILCIGLRGTPRKLGLVNEDLNKVSYDVIEPEQYLKKNIALVGGGNSAIESALLLSDPLLENKVTLIVRKDENQGLAHASLENINKLIEAQKYNYLKIFYSTQVSKIENEKIELISKNQPFELKNDYLFILAGTSMPTKFLQGLGVNIVKKFGES